MWLYKKASSLTRDEMIERLEYEETHNKSDYDNKKEFVKDCINSYKFMLDKYEKLISEGKLSKDDPNYLNTKKWLDPDNLGKWWDESQAKKITATKKYSEFISNPDASVEEFIELYRLYNEDNSSHLCFHNNDWYVFTVFDTYFRCFEYGDGPNPIDNYDDMISYLDKCHPNMIEQYGSFDENGNYNRYDPVNYKIIKKGLTDELKDMLKFLYKNNDIFIKFG